jgi:hypothetical protein
VLISEESEAREKSWAHFWDHPFGDALLLAAAVSTSSQRGSMVSSGSDVSRFHGRTPSIAEGVVGRGDWLPPLAGTDRIVGTALGVSASCDRQGLSAVATSKSPRASGLAHGNLAPE